MIWLHLCSLICALLVNHPQNVPLPSALLWKTSQVTYVTMVPRVGNETLRPLGFGAMLRTQASDEEADDVFARPSLYCGRAGSDVMGCRRPTDGVFSYVSSGTSHAGGVPHSSP